MIKLKMKKNQLELTAREAKNQLELTAREAMNQLESQLELKKNQLELEELQEEQLQKVNEAKIAEAELRDSDSESCSEPDRTVLIDRDTGDDKQEGNERWVDKIPSGEQVENVSEPPSFSDSLPTTDTQIFNADLNVLSSVSESNLALILFIKFQ